MRTASRSLRAIGLLSAGVAFVWASAAQADDTGFYLGAQAGYGSAVFDQTRTTTNGATTWGPQNLGGDGFVGGVFGGYGRAFGSFYLGGEGSFEVGKIESNFSDSTGYSRSVSLNETINLSVRPGYLITPQTLAYGRVGWARSKFKVSQQQNGDLPSTDEWIDGVVVGLGVEQEVTKTIGLRIDYRHTFYTDEPTNTNTAGTRTDKYDIDSNVVTVGVLYKF